MQSPFRTVLACTCAVFWWLAGALLPVSAVAQPLQPGVTVVVDNSFEQQELGRGLDFYINENGESLAESPLQVLLKEPWLTSEQDSLNFGFAPAPRWVFFSIRNDTDTPRELFLEVSHPYLNRLGIYQISSEDKVISNHTLGDRYPARDRPIRHAKFLAPLTIGPDREHRILMRVETTSINRIPITLWDQQNFISADYYRTLFQSVLYGIFIAISAYYLLLFIYIHEPAYAYWGIAILGLLFVIVSLDGTATALIWPSNTNLSGYLIMLGICGTCGASALFSKEVLKLSERPALGMLMNAVLAASVLLFTGALFAPYQTVLQIGLLLALLTAVIQMTVYLIRLFDGYEPARYVVIAIILLCLGVIINILTASGRLPSTFTGMNAVGIATTFAMLFYSLALSNRMNLNRALRQSAQARLASDLDQKVRERTEALQQANEQLVIASTTDGLTGLLNRRHFDQVFDTEYRSAYRQKQPIAVLMIDADHFKILNDTYGHQFGDLCLRSLAELITSCLNRPPDISARYGGEEFIVVLPYTTLEGAISVAEMIRETAAATPMQHQNQSISITLSIGVASITPVSPDQQDQLIRLADDALYRAKKGGRNRVEYA